MSKIQIVRYQLNSPPIHYLIIKEEQQEYTFDFFGESIMDQKEIMSLMPQGSCGWVHDTYLEVPPEYTDVKSDHERITSCFRVIIHLKPEDCDTFSFLSKWVAKVIEKKDIPVVQARIGLEYKIINPIINNGTVEGFIEAHDSLSILYPDRCNLIDDHPMGMYRLLVRRYDRTIIHDGVYPTFNKAVIEARSFESMVKGCTTEVTRHDDDKKRKMYSLKITGSDGKMLFNGTFSSYGHAIIEARSFKDRYPDCNIDVIEK